MADDEKATPMPCSAPDESYNMAEDVESAARVAAYAADIPRREATPMPSQDVCARCVGWETHHAVIAARHETVEACAKAIEATILDSESLGAEVKRRCAAIVRGATIHAAARGPGAALPPSKCRKCGLCLHQPGGDDCPGRMNAGHTGAVDSPHDWEPLPRVAYRRCHACGSYCNCKLAGPSSGETAERWPLYEIDTDDVCTLEGFDGVGLMTGDVRDGLRMSRETARALADRLHAWLRATGGR